MRRLIAVDPGDVHCGLAMYQNEGSGWYYAAGLELPPDEWEEEYARWVAEGKLDHLAYERYRLYADKAQEQKGSEFRTSQCIGAMLLIARLNNKHVAAHAAADRRDAGSPALLTCELPGAPCHDPTKVVLKHLTVHGEFADIKDPTRGILRHKGIKSEAKKRKLSTHCEDAELHGLRYILLQLKEDYIVV